MDSTAWHMTSQSEEFTGRDAFRAGMSDGFGIPGLGLFVSMMGFGAIALEAGLGPWVTFLTTVFVWGLPGQVAFAELYGSAAGWFALFVAVTLANMRMLPMTASGLPMMHLRGHGVGFAGRCLAAQFLAITGWAHIAIATEKYKPHCIFPYYIGLSIIIYCSALVGTMVGYYLNDFASDTATRIAVFSTPIYLILMVAGARRVMNQWAVGLGIAICPPLYLVIGDWSVMVAGLLGGTMAFLLKRRKDAPYV